MKTALKDVSESGQELGLGPELIIFYFVAVMSFHPSSSVSHNEFSSITCDISKLMAGPQCRDN
jgi:hypothetical protein